jgi:poly(A) polymerase
MLESGSAQAFIKIMQEFGMLEMLFPAIAHFIDGPHSKEIYHYLACCDNIHNKYGMAVIPRSVLLSCLLFPIYEKEINSQYLKKHQIPLFSDLVILANSLIKGFETSSFCHFPRRLSSTAAFILATQYRLTPLTGKISYRNKLLHNKEFILALKMLDIRSQVNPKIAEICSNWKKMLRSAGNRGEKIPHPHNQTVKDFHDADSEEDHHENQDESPEQHPRYRRKDSRHG